MRDPSNWKMETKICPSCNNEFTRPAWRKAKFCSYKCKMKIPWNKGKKCPQVSKENHYLWKKDRSEVKDYWTERNNPEYKQWRKEVFKQDDYKCKINNKDCLGKIVAHHILPWSRFPELRYEVNNGITLCQFHHPRKRNDEIRLVPTFNGLVLTRA